jgi:acyl carrier protein
MSLGDEMKEKELIGIISEITEIAPASISMEAKLEDLSWDSLSTLSFLAKIEQVLGETVDANKLSNAKTVNDIFEIISNR